MPGIILDILQCMKSASHLTISAWMNQRDEILVILARVYQGDETLVISVRELRCPSSRHGYIKGPIDGRDR